MNKKLRYFFIALSITAFIILAPLVVMFVSGVKVDLRNQEYQKTGILVAWSEPNDVEVFLNGEQKNNTPSTMRFLEQGEYSLTLKKRGYFDWSKTLAVEPNKITYNYEGVEAVQLIKNPQPIALPINKVSEIVYANGKLWYAGENLVGYVTERGDSFETTTITTPFTPITLTVMNDEEYILAKDSLNNKVIVDTRKKTVTVLPLGLNGASGVYMAPDGTIIAYKDNALYSFNPQNKTVKTLIQNLTGFTILGNTGYFATSANGFTIDTRKWSNGTFGQPEELLNTQITANSAQLLITKNKQLFVQINNELYRVNQELDLVSKQVNAVFLDPQTQELTFITPNELWFYNFLSNKSQLLTRISEKTNQFLIRSEIGYGFIANKQGVTVWEIDNRGNQNKYALFDQPSKNIALNHSISKLYVLIDGKVLLTELR